MVHDDDTNEDNFEMDFTGSDPILKEIYDCNWAQVDKLIADGIDLNVKTADGISALTMAMHVTREPEDLELFDYMVESGAMPQTDDLLSAITLCAESLWMIKVVALFIEKGIDVNATLEGDSPLSVAISVYANNSETFELLDMLIKAGANVNEIIDYGGIDMPLFILIIMGIDDVPHLFDLVPLFIEAGANPNAILSKGDQIGSILGASLTMESDQKYTVAQYLIDNGADVNFKIGQDTLLGVMQSENANGDHDNEIDFLIDNGAM